MTMVNVRAKNHPQQIAARGVDADADDRRTPDELWAPLNEEFRFTLDVAATEANTKCARWCHDGLEESWVGERVWCNPPYSNVERWVRKAWIETVTGCDLVVMLVPANRTEQSWWQTLIEPARDGKQNDIVDRGMRLTTRFLRGRQRFIRPGWTKPVKGDRPPFGLCLLIWSHV